MTLDAEKAPTRIERFLAAIATRIAARIDDEPDDPTPEPAEWLDRITAIYWRRVRWTGLGREPSGVRREELRAGITDCLRHFRAEDPDAVASVERSVKRYDRLREAAGIHSGLLEEPSRLLPGALGHVQAGGEALVGALPALLGFVLNVVPFAVARTHLRRQAEHGVVGAPGPRPGLGLLAFPIFYGILIGLTASQFSPQATVVLAVSIVPLGLFAQTYAKRMRVIATHVGGRTATWLRLSAASRVSAAQDELVAQLEELHSRYRVEALGWPPFRYRSRWAVLAAALRVPVAATVLVGSVLFVRAYVDRPVRGLPLGPSPWEVTRRQDPAAAERQLLRDARGVLSAARQLDRMQERMASLEADFDRGERSFLTQQDHDEIHVLVSGYLDLRDVLLRTVWLYRGDNAPTDQASPDDLEARAFVTAYTAAALLTEKAWVLYDRFMDDPGTRAELDRGDRAWGIPPGTFSDIVASLSNLSVMAELEAGLRRFEEDRLAGRSPAGTPWEDLADRAARSSPALVATFDGIGRRKLRSTLREMVRQVQAPADEVTPAVSMAISRFRLKERPPHRGLITPAQVEALRAELRPGDILIERRNWYISNSLLPGFWPHAALYLGTPAQLAELGVGADERAAPHLLEFGGEDELGRDFAVIEAIGEGVVFTSLERSVGEADAVAVLRPVLSQAERVEALQRALSHHGKEYDFDFDFETTDALVCTELIFRTYDGLLEIPEMRLIMGKPRIPATDYVRMWADGRAAGTPQLELVRFLDFDEANGVALEADPATLVETLDRSRFTFLR